MRASVIFGGAVALLLAGLPASAQQLVYHPNNPTFGGNPIDPTFYLSVAQDQGNGTKSGNQPNLTGLTNALNSLGTGSGSSAANTVANPTGN